MKIFKIGDDGKLIDMTHPWALKFMAYLPEAKASADKSKDRSTKVGAVVVDCDHNLRISGRNGFPRGANDNLEHRHERPLKYKWTGHAEENCVAQAARTGTQLIGCSLILTELHPCTTCSRMSIQAGIGSIYAPLRNSNNSAGMVGAVPWDEEAVIAMEMLKECGVQVLYYVEDDQEVPN